MPSVGTIHPDGRTRPQPPVRLGDQANNARRPTRPPHHGHQRPLWRTHQRQHGRVEGEMLDSARGRSSHGNPTRRSELEFLAMLRRLPANARGRARTARDGAHVRRSNARLVRGVGGASCIVGVHNVRDQTASRSDGCVGVGSPRTTWTSLTGVPSQIRSTPDTRSLRGCRRAPHGPVTVREARHRAGTLVPMRVEWLASDPQLVAT